MFDLFTIDFEGAFIFNDTSGTKKGQNFKKKNAKCFAFKHLAFVSVVRRGIEPLLQE